MRGKSYLIALEGPGGFGNSVFCSASPMVDAIVNSPVPR
jgi:hypothetical protein